MMSKNSFLANLKENSKRRVWLWILSGLFWFLYYPVGMMMIMGRQNNENLIYGYSEARSRELLTKAALNWIGNFDSAGYMFIICVVAAVCAVQGFSYLYHKRKVDFYHSIPVKKSRRFAVIYLNGVLIFFLPYLVNMALALAVAGVNGAMDKNNMAAAAVCLASTLLLFFGIYGLTLIAVMLTGNIIITAFAAIIFVFYEAAVKWLMEDYCASFYQYFSYESIDATLYLSPIGQLTKGLQAASFGAALPHLLAMIGMAVGFAAAAWFCYAKRPAEAAGKAMAFEKTKGVVKILLVVPFALGVGLTVMDIIGDKPYAMMVFGMVMAVIIGSCTIEVIYEMDIRAVLRKKHHILISGACVAVIFLIFCFDLTGFDKWVPDPGKLEDAVVVFMNDMYGNGYVDADFNAVDNVDYFLSKPGISDVDAICELSNKKSGDGRIWCTVAYRMKSGRVAWRSFPVSEDEEELLDRIMSSKEYKEAKCQLYDDEVFEGLKKNRISELAFSTGFKVENLTPEGLDEFRGAYLKDMENFSYSMLRNELACGRVSFEVEKEVERGALSRRFRYEIYPSYTNTLAFLEKNGVYNGSYLDVDGIAGITVTNYHYDMAEMAEEDANVNYAVTKSFYEEAQIQDVAQALYPTIFDDFWKAEGMINNDYEVTVQYKDGATDDSYYRGYNTAHLIADRIPAWLEKETAYE